MAEQSRPETVFLPALPLRDMVVYPHMVLPLFVGRPKSVAALNAAMDKGQTVFLIAQRNGSEEEPTVHDLHETGTIAEILQVLKLPDGTVKVLVEGKQRAAVTTLQDNDSYFEAEVTHLPDENSKPTEQ